MPLHLRNAPTQLMKELDYGKGYQYAHDEADAVADMECLPPALAGRQFYEPTERGFEKEIKRRLDGLGRRAAGPAGHVSRRLSQCETPQTPAEASGIRAPRATAAVRVGESPASLKCGIFRNISAAAAG